MLYSQYFHKTFTTNPKPSFGRREWNRMKMNVENNFRIFFILLFESFNGDNGKFILLFGNLSGRKWNE